MGLLPSPHIVHDGLIVYLDAANSRSYPGSGTDIFDLSRNGNNGVLQNGITYSAGELIFDGSNSHISIPSKLLASNITFSFTCALYNPTSPSYDYTIIRNVADDRYYFKILNGAQFSWRSLGGLYYWTSNRDTSGYQIVTVVNDGSEDMVVYQDATSLGKVAVPNTGTITRTGIGPYQNGGSMYLYVEYNRALSATEVSQNFNAIRRRIGL